jgi:hypothetical protein
MNAVAAEQRRPDPNRIAAAAYAFSLTALAVLSLFLALAADGSTPDGFKVWLLASISGYAAVRRWIGDVPLRQAVAYYWHLNRLGERVTAVLGLLLLAAVLFPVFGKARAQSGPVPSRLRSISMAFQSAAADLPPSDHLPPIRTQREAQEWLAPYLERELRGYNSLVRRRGWKKDHIAGAEGFWRSEYGDMPFVFNTRLGGMPVRKAFSMEGPQVIAWDEEVRFYDSGGYRHYYRLALFTDGLRSVNSNEWEQIRPRW